MRTVCIVLVLFVLFASLNVFGLSCDVYNIATGPFPFSASGTKGHNNGSHAWTVIFTGSAFYTGYTLGVPCKIHASMAVQAAAADTGSIQFPYMDHSIKWASKSGDIFSNGPTISADGEAAVDVIPCFFTGCGIAPSISGSGGGAGFSVTFPSGQIWSDQKYLKVVAGGPVYPTGCRPNQCCDGASSDLINPISVCGPSPIVISLRHGVDATKAFTDPSKACVFFDLKNDGKPLCYSWPRRGSGIAFLVRVKNGETVHQGSQTFGDQTKHSNGDYTGFKNPNKTGYLALGFFDQLTQGGNMDLEITKEDKIWRDGELQLWTPDHCWDYPSIPCESIPSELHSLEEYKIHSIGWVYQVSGVHDEWRNAFRFYGQLNPHKQRLQEPEESSKERRSWDVFLTSRP